MPLCLGACVLNSHTMTLCSAGDDLAVVKHMARRVRRILAQEEAEQARIEQERQEEARVRREQQQRDKAERERADRERAERWVGICVCC